MRKAAKYLTLTGFVIFSGGIIYASIANEEKLKGHGLLQAQNKNLTKLGKTLYASHCASCHGQNLEGQVKEWRSPGEDGLLPAPPHDQTGHTWHHNDQLLFDITKYGTAKAANLEGYQSAMPAYENILSDEEIIAVLSFIKSTWPSELQSTHDRLNAATKN